MDGAPEGSLGDPLLPQVRQLPPQRLHRLQDQIVEHNARQKTNEVQAQLLKGLHWTQGGSQGYHFHKRRLSLSQRKLR